MAITFVNGLVLCVCARRVVKELYVSLYDCGGYYFVFVSVTLNVSKSFWPAIHTQYEYGFGYTIPFVRICEASVYLYNLYVAL